MTLTQIEELAGMYADSRSDLAALVQELEFAVEALKAKRMPALKKAVAKATQARDELHSAIDDQHDLFTKPRTKVFHGIKVGLTKQRGKVVIDDQEKVITRIREQLPKDQAELLIKTKESVHKPAVYDLVAADLKRLGIKLTDDCDAVVVKAMDSEVSKLVDALLEDEGDDETSEKAA